MLTPSTSAPYLVNGTVTISGAGALCWVRAGAASTVKAAVDAGNTAAPAGELNAGPRTPLSLVCQRQVASKAATAVDPVLDDAQVGSHAAIAAPRNRFRRRLR